MDTTTRNTNTPKTVAIIGSGWSGCHTALELSSTGKYTVTILEKSADIFAGVSGQFGIRIHRGPHYPRSSGTRESCRRSFDRFTEKYRDLVVPVDPAVYSLARYDSMGKESKVKGVTILFFQLGEPASGAKGNKSEKDEGFAPGQTYWR
ncbi:hypothetical protein BJX66DRAFT_264474 [Aspergillus keveii]|uniref:FAD dependent oxidoreductase domain-containing protein n=1 Tax=Aspergillus keveii TaxID=714993 RepID=A0ABR4FXZ2_9EURO